MRAGWPQDRRGDGDGSACHRTEEEIECGLGFVQGECSWSSRTPGGIGWPPRKWSRPADGRHGHAASPLYSTEVGERPVVGLGCTVHTAQSTQQHFLIFFSVKFLVSVFYLCWALNDTSSTRYYTYNSTTTFWVLHTRFHFIWEGLFICLF